LVIQYLTWLKNVTLHSDFGESYATGGSISAELMRTLPITLEIVTLGFFFSILVSIPIGLLCAFKENSLVDHLARVVAVVGVSIPGFWLGLMLIHYLCMGLHIFPPGGFAPISMGLSSHLKSVALPSLALGIYYVAILSRMTRSTMLEVLEQDYVRTSKAMGLPGWRLLVYTLKNALVPVVSVGAMSFGYMFGWALIIEQVFNIAGISRALLTAIFQRDYQMVQASVLVITAIFVIANLAADILYRFLNPKLRESAL
jgi:peptide/nickel transport system permease protein